MEAVRAISHPDNPTAAPPTSRARPAETTTAEATKGHAPEDIPAAPPVLVGTATAAPAREGTTVAETTGLAATAAPAQIPEAATGIAPGETADNALAEPQHQDVPHHLPLQGQAAHPTSAEVLIPIMFRSSAITTVLPRPHRGVRWHTGLLSAPSSGFHSAHP